MKTSLTTLIFCLLFCVQVFAQIQRGTIAPAGQIGFDYQWAEEDIYGGLYTVATPSLAFMVSDHWLIGGAIGTAAYSGVSSGVNSIIQPEFRYFFNPGSEKNNYFASFIPSLNVTDIDNSLYNFSLGLDRFINRNLALEGMATYQLIGDGRDQFTLSLNLRPFMDRNDRDSWKTAISDHQKGDLLVGLGLARVSYVADILTLGLYPKAGLFLSDRLVLGAELTADASFRSHSQGSIRSGTVVFGPFVRHYFSGQQHWRWFAEAGGVFQSSHTVLEESFNANNYSWQISGIWGANLHLTENLAFEFGLQSFFSGRTFSRVEYFMQGPSPENIENFVPNRRFGLGLHFSIQHFIQRSGKK